MAVLLGMPKIQYSVQRARLYGAWLPASELSAVLMTYLHFAIRACFSSTSVSQPAQRRTWFTQYRRRTSSKIWRVFLYGVYTPGE